MSRIVRLLISAFLLTALLSAPVSALTEIPKTVKPLSSVAVTATAGGYLFSSSQEQKSTPIYGLKLSYDYLGSSVTDSIGLEATFNYFNTSSKATGKSSAGYLVRGDLLYLFVPRGTWVPYLALGGGDLIVENSTGKDHSPLINYGLGLRYFWDEWLALRVDARQLFVYENVSTRNNYELSAGVMYVFGKEHKKKNQAILPKAQLPSNLPKAIPDLVDPEPVTPVPADPAEQFSTLEKLGAVGIPVVGVVPRSEPFQPASRPPAAPKAPLPLAFQEAAKSTAPSAPPAAQPEPAQPAPVNATPPPVPAATPQPGEEAQPSKPAPRKAPVESAEPAAPQAAPDALPAPVPAPPAPPAAAADQVELPQPGKVKVVSYLTVEFDFSSSVVRPQYLKKLAAVAAKIKAASQSATRIGGHTDNIGKAQPNLVLSLQRAQNVKDELVKLGVDPKTITIVGYGFTRPKASNQTSEGRQRNRRASAVITVVTYVDSPAAAPAPGTP